MSEFSMKTTEEIKKILLLIKLDAQALCERIKLRQSDYIRTMALKRTREHFRDVFRSRYENIKIDELKCFTEEIILEIDRFYNEVERLRWYLMHTEDMPATVADYTSKKIYQIEAACRSLMTYLEAELMAQDS